MSIVNILRGKKKTTSEKKTDPQKAAKREARIQKVMELTGKDRDSVNLDMKEVYKKYHIGSADYVKYSFHDLSEEERAVKAADISEERELVARVAEEMDWDPKETRSRMRKDLKAFKVSRKDYVNFGLYKLSGDELEESLRKIRELKRKENCINEAMAEMGWSREEAVSRIDEAVSRLGITYSRYRKSGIYRLAPEEQLKAIESEDLLKKTEKQISKVMEITGMDHDTIKRDMEDVCEKYQLDPADYVKYSFYRLSEAKRSEKAADLREESELASVVSAETGWDEKEIRSKMRKDLKSMNISRQSYVKYGLYKLEGSALDEKLKDVQAIEEKEACITESMTEMGWSKEEAEANISEALSRLGISYSRYRRYKLYRIDPEDQAKEISDRIVRARKSKAEEEKMILDIMERNAWNKEEAEADYERIKKKWHCRFSEYWQYHLDEMTDDEIENILFIRDHGKLRRKFLIDPELKHTMDSKEAADRMFSAYLRRPWCINKEVEREEFHRIFKDAKGVVYKPVFGLQARGVEAFRFSEMDMDTIYDTLSGYPKGVVEGLVIQHPDLMKINPSSVNCLRVESISSFSQPVTSDGKHADIFGVSLKTGGGQSIVDNLHAGGGVCVSIDLDTGIVITGGADWTGKGYENHPVTGVALRGLKIPYFQEAKEFVLKMIDDLHIEGVIGWDIAIGEDGPLLIEPNGNPDPALLNLPFIPDHNGIKARLDKYL